MKEAYYWLDTMVTRTQQVGRLAKKACYSSDTLVVRQPTKEMRDTLLLAAVKAKMLLIRLLAMRIHNYRRKCHASHWINHISGNL